MTLKEKLIEFLADHARDLREIYQHFDDETESTIRGRLNENIGKCFRRITRGVYIATVGDTQALLIEGDAWKRLDDFEDECFDAIITDPPYSVLNEQMQTGTTRKRNLNKGWDFETNDIDEELFAKMLRVLKPGGHFFCFMPASKHDTIDYIHDQVKTAERAGFTFNSQWVWDKKVLSLGYSGRPRHELILFFSKGKRHLYPKGHSMRSTADVLVHPRIMSKKKKVHQTEKPIELIMDLVKFSTLPGDVVLDPFAGSFSLGMATMLTGRHAVGIEMNPEFARAGIARMRESLDIEPEKTR
jgi:site-specific DNA-methyltransferase (adenine-specific)